MNKKRKGAAFHLSKKFLWIFLLAGFLPLLIFGIISFYQPGTARVSAKINQYARELQSEQMIRNARFLEDRILKKAENDLLLLGKVGTLYFSFPKIWNKTHVETILNHVLENNRNIARTAWLVSATEIMSLPGPGTFALKDFPCNLADSEHNPSRHEVWSPGYIKSGRWMVSGMVPVYSGNTFKAVAGIEIDVADALGNLIDKSYRYAGAVSFLVDRSGQVLAASQAAPDILGIKSGQFNLRENGSAALKPVAENMCLKSDTRTIRLGNIEYFVAYQPINIAGWGLAVMTPCESFTEGQPHSATWQIDRGCFFIWLFLCGLSIVVGVVAAFRLGRPVARLHKMFVKADLQGLEKFAARSDYIGDMAKYLSALIAKSEENRVVLEALENQKMQYAEAEKEKSGRLAELESQLDEKQEQMDKCLQQNEILKKEKEGIFKQNANLLEKLSGFEKKLRQQEAEAKSRSAELEQSKHLLDEMKISKDKFEQEAADQNKNLRQREEEMKKVLSELEAMKRKVTEREKEWQSRINELSKTLDEQRQHLVKLKTETPPGKEPEKRDSMISYIIDEPPAEAKKPVSVHAPEKSTAPEQEPLPKPEKPAAEEPKRLSGIFVDTPAEKTKEEVIDRNVLLIDDGVLVELYWEKIYQMGFSLHIAANANLALQKLAFGHFDFIVINVSMKGFNIEEFYQKIKSAEPELAPKIIYFTAEPAEQELAKSLEQKNAVCISRKTPLEEIEKIVRRIANADL